MVERVENFLLERNLNEEQKCEELRPPFDQLLFDKLANRFHRLPMAFNELVCQFDEFPAGELPDEIPSDERLLITDELAENSAKHESLKSRMGTNSRSARALTSLCEA